MACVFSTFTMFWGSLVVMCMWQVIRCCYLLTYVLPLCCPTPVLEMEPQAFPTLKKPKVELHPQLEFILFPPPFSLPLPPPGRGMEFINLVGLELAV